MAALAIDLLTHFQHFLKKGWWDLLQTRHNCSLRIPVQVLLLFYVHPKSKWPPGPLIGWHIFIFFPRMADGIYSKLDTNVPFEVPTKCSYF